jgi:hypothetical protein
MWYGAGPDAPEDDVARLQAIVDLLKVDAEQPEIRIPGTDAPGFVLWGGTNDDGSTWTIEARPTDVNVDLKLVTREMDGTYSEGGFADFDVPPKDVEGGSMGVVSEDAERVEWRPGDGGEPALAQLIDLPASLSYAADAYWFPEGYPTKDVPAEGKLVAVMPRSSTPAEPPPDGDLDWGLLAEGTYPEPDGRGWSLEIRISERIDAATGDPARSIRFAWDGGAGGGGGGSISLLDGHVFRGLHHVSGTEIPDSLIGPVGIEASRVVYRPETGDPIEARLIAVPERFLGPAQIFLVTAEFGAKVPDGRLIAYDERGQVLDTYLVA